MKYKTVIEVITEADNEDEALDMAGEYLRGTYNSYVPLRVRTHSLTKKNYKLLGYTLAICFLALGVSLGWFSAGRTYQQIASTQQQKALETYAVHPPLKTDSKQEVGKEFKKAWDRLYREKVLYGEDKNIAPEQIK